MTATYREFFVALVILVLALVVEIIAIQNSTALTASIVLTVLAYSVEAFRRDWKRISISRSGSNQQKFISS